MEDIKSLVIESLQFGEGAFMVDGREFIIGHFFDRICMWADDLDNCIYTEPNVCKEYAAKHFEGPVAAIEDYLKEQLRCWGCKELIPFTDIGGKIMGGSYCKKCWENKYKFIADEKYE